MKPRSQVHVSQPTLARREGYATQAKTVNGVLAQHPVAPSEQSCFTDLATAVADVSAYCRAVISRVVPHDFWGEGEAGLWNKQVVMCSIDQFISMRRFESLTLHEVAQSLKASQYSSCQ